MPKRNRIKSKNTRKTSKRITRRRNRRNIRQQSKVRSKTTRRTRRRNVLKYSKKRNKKGGAGKFYSNLLKINKDTSVEWVSPLSAYSKEEGLDGNEGGLLGGPSGPEIKEILDADEDINLIKDKLIEKGYLTDAGKFYSNLLKINKDTSVEWVSQLSAYRKEEAKEGNPGGLLGGPNGREIKEILDAHEDINLIKDKLIEKGYLKNNRKKRWRLW